MRRRLALLAKLVVAGALACGGSEDTVVAEGRPNTLSPDIAVDLTSF